MEVDEWPEPKRDTTDLLFLYPFYESPHVIRQDSPQHARKINERRADRLAVKLVEKLTQYSQIYDDDSFPVINLEDPCGLLPKLPVRLWHRSWHRSNWSHEIVGLKPVLERQNTPSSMEWLGKLNLDHYPSRNPRISSICLNQPGEDSSIVLGQQPGRYPDRNKHTDSYPVNAQAMSFISLVDNYLDELDQNRLIIVRD